MYPITAAMLLVLPVLLFSTCAGTKPAPTETGNASYYSRSLHGKPTANGEVYDENEFTAAHRTLPFGTRVRVTNLENNESVVVRINDRGPYADNRIIDLSFAAARKIGMIEAGIIQVSIERIR